MPCKGKKRKGGRVSSKDESHPPGTLTEDKWRNYVTRQPPLTVKAIGGWAGRQGSGEKWPFDTSGAEMPVYKDE
jgi:hypothetical protein